ncbi:serine-rich adhesin for platelets isoform X3 [Parasteatoda tepidariorum]|uniref:serine-rich adhesin for platelets isoform X3 n=1 Tax=Parasteatoda tepidariorum TaxID=114398 RepID=UPI00077FBFB5|nr:uncharacterized protein LOC107453362 isoform X2 [Parasteatoda tepidariorum]
MAQLNRQSLDYSAQVADPLETNYAAASANSQQCSSCPNPQGDSLSMQQSVGLPSPDNNGTTDQKPALPPKPFYGPPIYREPPNPPNHDVPNHHHHPDICMNTSTPPRPSDPLPYMHHAHHSERPDRPGSRTHAWVQEHKTSGKLVGEKWSSLQRKLRSFLTQSTSSKELTELEKGPNDEEKPRIEESQEYSMPGFNANPSSVADQRLSYISSSSFSGNSVALSLSQPVTHMHHCRPYQVERHPFAASTNVSEHEHDHEEATDPDQLRDTCSKFFAREQRISWSNYLSPRNCYSNNIKSSYDYDKLVPKEVIGRPSQEKRPEVPVNPEAIYGGIAPFPSFSRTHDSVSQPSQSQQPDLQSGVASGACYAKSVHNTNEESSIPAPSNEVKVPNKSNETVSPDNLQLNSTDCGDSAEVYKSSSESGRGTMHSSMHGSKSVVSPHSSGVSVASNLDTSLDSDHSVNGGIWDQQARECQDKHYTKDCQVSKVRHVYETPNTSMTCRQTNEKDEQNDVSSESLYDNPSHQAVSLAASPLASAENSPKLPSRSKYKFSMSASALNSCKKSIDHQQKTTDTAVKTSGKKTSMRRSTSSNQVNCRHRSGKSSQFSKSTFGGHRLGIAHGNYSPKKCSSSPPSTHHSRNQLVSVFPCYLDNGDPELTSNTTGLDMESLLDDEEDYSSDLSATASTLEPTEVSMIRKQLEGLETMYSEILHLLGVKNSCKANPFAASIETSRHSRHKLNGSLSSLTGPSSTSRGNHSFMEKRSASEKRRTRECRTSSAGKRLQRLESHVVTLARSVAHLSSEMRTQHVLVQELENMRQDVTWVQERLRLMQLAQGCHPNNGGGRNPAIAAPRAWDNFHKEVIELLNPCRAKKLTKFFGDEPPLIRQFLKRLGYEKYATNFETEKIGIKELPYLTEERLQKMGIPMGPRIRILQEAISCYPQNQYKVYIV